LTSTKLAREAHDAKAEAAAARELAVSLGLEKTRLAADLASSSRLQRRGKNGGLKEDNSSNNNQISAPSPPGDIAKRLAELRNERNQSASSNMVFTRSHETNTKLSAFQTPGSLKPKTPRTPLSTLPL
jgi:hypothetical protein